MIFIFQNIMIYAMKNAQIILIYQMIIVIYVNSIQKVITQIMIIFINNAIFYAKNVIKKEMKLIIIAQNVLKIINLYIIKIIIAMKIAIMTIIILIPQIIIHV